MSCGTAGPSVRDPVIAHGSASFAQGRLACRNSLSVTHTVHGRMSTGRTVQDRGIICQSHLRRDGRGSHGSCRPRAPGHDPSGRSGPSGRQAGGAVHPRQGSPGRVAGVRRDLYAERSKGAGMVPRSASFMETKANASVDRRGLDLFRPFSRPSAPDDGLMGCREIGRASGGHVCRRRVPRPHYRSDGDHGHRDPPRSLT